ncbi:uncharacterized protein LOC126810594 [Patella vulgata]|uniref:uncharacterized protein LOC126810594 n=1 Tax=Patella vulgata TaxID=6465 RepID=UPI00217FE77E|nr:uncharacterized protein LOC126810594 [Patella vulgata]
MKKKYGTLWLLLIGIVLYTCLQIYLIGSFCSTDDFIGKVQRFDTKQSLEYKFAEYKFPDSIPRDVLELERRKVPNIFYYVFCSRVRNHTFTFHHYLSVISVWRNFEPDAIEINYKGAIIQDKYNIWLDELKLKIPSLIVKEMPDYWMMNDGCASSYGIAALRDRGGVFVSSGVVLTKHSLLHMDTQFSLIVDYTNNIKVVFSTLQHPDLNYIKIDSALRYVNPNKNFSSITNICDEYKNKSFEYSRSHCMVVISSLLPKDLFAAKNSQDNYLYHLYTGKRTVRRSNDTQVISENCDVDVPYVKHIPKIVHYIWFHSVKLTYAMYLSLISTLYIVQPDKIYIHSDLHIHGDYWEKLKNNSKIILVYRESPRTIFGHKVKYSTHGSDIVRADILFKYGGVYLDWDAIWLKPIDDLLTSGFPAIANYDHMVATVTFPRQINLGVAMAKPRSKFIQKWQEAFVNYKSDDFYYNALQLPYQIFERNPELLHIEDRLQVMCLRLKCHPIFHKDHRDWTREQPFDWHHVYAIHFTYPDPPEFKSESVLLKSTGMFADIGRRVLSKSPGIED